MEVRTRTKELTVGTSLHGAGEKVVYVLAGSEVQELTGPCACANIS